MGETLRPCSPASATSGPDIENAMNAGSSVISASDSERKISTSSTMMNSADRLSSWLPVLPDAFCWSTWMAMSPARCACSPARQMSLGDLGAQRVHQVGVLVLAPAEPGQHHELVGVAVRRPAQVLDLV